MYRMRVGAVGFAALLLRLWLPAPVSSQSPPCDVQVAMGQSNETPRLIAAATVDRANVCSTTPGPALPGSRARRPAGQEFLPTGQSLGGCRNRGPRAIL